MDTGTIIALIISGVTLLLTLGVGAIAYGVLKQKVDDGLRRNESQDETIKELATKVELQAVVIRANEDRDRNDKRIEELFNSRNEHAKIMERVGESMTNLASAFAELKTDFKEGLRELRDDIKKAGCV